MHFLVVLIEQHYFHIPVKLAYPKYYISASGLELECSLAQLFEDSNGINIRFKPEELTTILTSDDTGESIYEIVGLDASARYSPNILLILAIFDQK